MTEDQTGAEDQTGNGDQRGAGDHPGGAEHAEAEDGTGAAAAGDNGSALVAVAFNDPLKAQEAMITTLRLQRTNRLQLEDAAIVTHSGGRVRIAQTKDLNPSTGALSGSWWGLLAGLFVGNPLLGAALGAGAGGLLAKLRDLGIDDDQMKQLGEELPDGHAALFLLLSDCHLVACLAEARRFDGTLLYSTIDSEIRHKLVDALAVPTGTWG